MTRRQFSFIPFLRRYDAPLSASFDDRMPQLQRSSLLRNVVNRRDSHSARGFHSDDHEVADANRRHHGNLRVECLSPDPLFHVRYEDDTDAATMQRLYTTIEQEEEKSWCVNASREFQADEVVLTANILETSSFRHSHTLQIGTDKHVLIDLPSRFINHACGPDKTNVGIRIIPNDNDDGNGGDDDDRDRDGDDNDVTIQFVALRTISKHEELLWDYECTEYEVHNRFDCRCGSSVCRGEIKGFKYHSKQVLETVTDRRYIAPHLLRTL